MFWEGQFCNPIFHSILEPRCVALLWALSTPQPILAARLDWEFSNLIAIAINHEDVISSLKCEVEVQKL